MTRRVHRLSRSVSARAACALVSALGFAAGTLAIAPGQALAGTYTINNCPSAAGSTSNGSWSSFDTATPANAKGTCPGAITNDYIGINPVSSLSVNDTYGSAVGVPGGTDITIVGATVNWIVAGSNSGGDTFLTADAINSSGGNIIANAECSVGSAGAHTSTGDCNDVGGAASTWSTANGTMPTGVTYLSLYGYCANDAMSQPCQFSNNRPSPIEIRGASLTLSTSTLPSASSVGGALAGGGTVSGAAALTFTASSTTDGVRRASLLVDGQQAATDDYSASCAYTNFAACQLTESGQSISYNTSSLTDGSHTVALVITDAAGNVYTETLPSVTTVNDPTPKSGPSGTPSISGTAVVGSTLTGIPASFTGASTVTGQWYRCPANVSAMPNASCVAVSGQTGTGYDVTSADSGYELVYASTATGSAPAGNQTIVYSTPTAVVPTPAPSGSGSSAPGVGTVLTGTDPSVPSGYTITSRQWGYCETGSFVAIPGATGKTYTVTSADQGHSLCYEVIATDGQGHSITYVSSPTPIATSSGSTGGSGSNGSSGGTSNSGGGSTTTTGGSSGQGGNGGAGGPGVLVLVCSNGVCTEQSGVQGTTARWSLNLNVNPHKVKRGTKITLSGAVSTTPQPGTGKIVDLSARTVNVSFKHKHGKRVKVITYSGWVNFMVLRANSHGAYSASYRFKLGGKHTYQFIALAPAEGNFHNGSGASNTVTVIER